MTGHQTALTALHSGLSGNHQNQFRTIFGPKICIFLRYSLTTPNVWALVDPTRCDHNFPTYWGNSGYLWFSGRCPFNRLAGYYEASNGQNGSIWGQKCSFFGSKSMFWRQRRIFLIPSWQDTKNTTFLCWLGYMAGLRAAAGAEKLHFWPPKRPLWAIGAVKRPAERPNGHLPEKLKVSWVTSGYGGDMIPSSRVRPSPKNGGYMGVA